MKRGDQVIWKTYGFVHILRDKHTTLCGTDISTSLVYGHVEVNNNPKSRPLCGTCRKLKNK